MPYKWPDELKEISKELGEEEDVTLKSADKTGGGVDEDEINEEYTPVSIAEKIYIRTKGSTLDWGNYLFEVTFEDGTRQEFPFTAPDDGAAKKMVADRKSLVHSQNGTYKLSKLETPKELEAGDLKETVETNEKKSKADEKKSKADAKAEPKKEEPEEPKKKSRADTSEK